MGNCACHTYKIRRASTKDSQIEEYKDNIELGRCHKCSGEFVESIVYFKKCLEISHIFETNCREIESLSEIGVAYYELENYEMALDSFLKMYDCSKASIDNIGIKVATSNLAALYEKTGRNTEAIQMYQEHIKASSEIDDSSSEVILTYYDIAMIYHKLADTEAARKYLLIAFDLASVHGHPKEKLLICSQMADFYCRKGACDDALWYFEEELKTAKQLHKETDMQRIHKQIGKVYLSIKQYLDAEFHYNEALRLAKKFGDSITLVMAHMQLSSLYKTMGKKEDAKYHKKRAVSINSNIKKLPNGTNFTNMRVPSVYQSQD